MENKVRSINPLVPVAWLEEHLNDSGLVVLDIRSDEDYRAGHIPHAISIPASVWSTARDELFLELPEEADLFNLLDRAGISGDRPVVVVHKTADPPRPPSYLLADACRVADTLIYSGLKNVAVLDGGYNKWADEGKASSTDIVVPLPVSCRRETVEGMFVSGEYVWERLGQSLILDTRDAEVYFGARIEPTAPLAGHIPGSKSLPAPWIWNDDGTYKNPAVLAEMASGVLGDNLSREIIVYCGVGGYASAWWFVLTQVLGYSCVKFYDGSAQDWVRRHQMVSYRWE